MTRLMLCLLVLAASIQCFADERREYLSCDGVRWLEGLGKPWNNMADYLPATVETRIVCADSDHPGYVVGTSLQGGDQYTIFRFKKTDFDLWLAGNAAEIPGTYEDGYDWANGYNVRAKFEVRCR